jgi:NAD+-dependent secondary alcohol dehydrogenase Adh1
MKAVQLGQYEREPKLVDVSEPQITSPLDVLVRVGGSGVCRTDLHIIGGQWQEKSGVELPYTLGHENAGWVHEVGSAVTSMSVGDPVILYPLATCGLCPPAGTATTCTASIRCSLGSTATAVTRS